MDTTWYEVRISLCHGHSYTIGLKIWLSFGIPIRFVLHPTGSRLRHSGVFNDDLSIVATNRIGERIKGKVTLDEIKATVNLNAQSFHARGDSTKSTFSGRVIT